MKLRKNDRSNKKLYTSLAILSSEVTCPCLEAIYMYKFMKNLCKIRIHSRPSKNLRRFFGVIIASCDAQNLPYGSYLP